MAEQTTGQIDQLIEQKVTKKINEFTQTIADQILKFLEDNGEYSPTTLKVANGWKSQVGQSTKTPEDYISVYISDFRKSLASGIADSVRRRMIARATKDLLDKVSLLG